MKFKRHVGKVDCAANVPLYNFFGSKLRKSFKMGISSPRNVFGSKPFEFLQKAYLNGTLKTIKKSPYHEVFQISI